uniref:Oxysterol-binding protein n=1 Tax=Macrostomum lignano TaxID=282301 RepID=A0A1I8HVB7_9PLAT
MASTGPNASNSKSPASNKSRDVEEANDSSVATFSSDSRHQIRSQLPVEMKPRTGFSFWEFMKNCIGKELTRIAMPISFNEPLSFLQRVTEYLEYSKLLFQAARSDDPVQRLEYIAALVVSGASSNWDRLSKPFNPLQGETYELDRTRDLGFRAVCEQVSHHPPTSAYHAEAADGSWLFHGSVSPKLSFWGKTVDVAPKGVVTVELPKRDEVYTYQNVPCKVHNILFGKLWVEHCGDVTITNHRTGHRCELRWHQSSWFSSDYHRITGYIYDGKGRKQKALYGKWVDAFYSVPADAWGQFKRGGHRRRRQDSKSADDDDDDQPVSASSGGPDNNGSGVDKSGLRSSQSDRSLGSAASQSDSVNSADGAEDNFSPSRGADTDMHLSGQTCLWRQRPRPADCEKYYNFTAFAMALNDDTDAELLARLPPTDSRRRPDVRALENADSELAQSEKARLEEKQRQVLKLAGGLEARRLWFKQWRNPHSGSKEADWLFSGDYWARDWTRCADIF